MALLVSKWAFGHAAAINAETREVAELGVLLAPSDPKTHLAHAFLLDKTFLPADQAESAVEFERSVALVPGNYLNWLALGRSREQNGDVAGAEAAMRHALDLAPHYSRVRWALGNLLVRQGRYDDGFAYMRDAAATDSALASAASATAWQIFGGDTAKIKTYLGDDFRIAAAFAVMLATEKKFAEAFNVWSKIPPGRKLELKDSGQTLYNEFLKVGAYSPAIETANSIGMFAESVPGVGLITNGGFESPLKVNAQDPFGWLIADGSFPRVGLNDAQKKNGSYSLLMNFGSGGQGFRSVMQRVGVESGATYELIFNYRSELKTTAKIRCEVLTADAKLLAITFLPATADWAEVRTPFVVPVKIEGIEVKLIADECEAPGCPISGNIWFDDFSINKR